jgi:hypothetical protein
MKLMQTSAQVRRKDHWQRLFHDFIEARGDQPFAWGTNDCCTFAADAVLAMTGVDLAADYRGQYSDQFTAQARMATVTGVGGATVEDVLAHAASQFGLTEWPTVKLAQRGDLLVFDGGAAEDAGVSVGVVYLNGVHAAFVAPDGLHRIPVVKCRRAWRVG